MGSGEMSSNASPTLVRFGVDSARLRSIEQALAQLRLPLPPGWARELLERSADPLLAVTNLERLLPLGDPSEQFAKTNAALEAWRALICLCGASPSLTNVLVTCGSQWPAVFVEAWQAPAREARAHAQALSSAQSGDWPGFASALRRHRHREYLRIGLADLLHPDNVESTWTQISELADGCIEATYHWARAALAREYGEACGAGDVPLGFVVLAMGKLGGQELNFSSDVDLVYLYEADAGETTGGRETLSPRAFFTRLSELITRTLQEVTEDGFAFRVDLRLRPDGMNGPITNSVPNALLYYESYGQTWERTALLKARPCAGDPHLGELFLREIRPFVYRRYLDYSTVEDMQRMKQQIDLHTARKGGDRDVKLGRGGIREAEFVVQVFQLIYGGRDERVRCRSTVQALANLIECRYLPANEGEALIAAYRFLRNVEHKIQIVAQRQTHVIPNDPREEETLARRLGFWGDDARDRFWTAWRHHTSVVRNAFEQLFYQARAERRAQPTAEVEHLLRVLDDREQAIAVLRSLGFREPETGYEHLRLLRDGPPSSPSTPRRRQVLYELAPVLLHTMRQSPSPDLALRNMANLIAAIGARTSFLLLLRENPGTLRMLVNLFATSQYLANQFIRHPEMLDSLVRADLVRIRRIREELSAELSSLLAAGEDFEHSLDVLRRFRNQEFLRIGIASVQDLLDPEEVSAELTLLAEVCLEGACRVARDSTLARFSLGELPGEFVVLALGKFGAGELNFNSDLDLIFVYRGAAARSGDVTPHEVFTWFAQRLMTVLQVRTKEGIAYQIDTRLRPSGHSGPLVSSLESFQRYHAQSAQVWERQALIKARAVHGSEPLRVAVEAIVEQFVYRAPLTVAEVREIRRLRGRMERELARERHGHVNIKTGRGGLVDIEFLVQMLQLVYGPNEPSLRCRKTLAALDALCSSGVLAEESGNLLKDGYRFLRRLEQSLRLIHDRPVEDLERGDLDVVVVARRLGFTGEGDAAAEELWREYERRREAIRRQYEEWFDRAERNELPRLRQADGMTA